MNLAEFIELLTALRDQNPNAEVRVATFDAHSSIPEYHQIRQAKFGNKGVYDHTNQVLIFIKKSDPR